MSWQPRIELKTWPEQYQAILDGRKTFEWRREDRGSKFEPDDVLWLREWVPAPEASGDASQLALEGRYTGRQMLLRVTYVVRSTFGLPNGYALMSIRVIASV